MAEDQPHPAGPDLAQGIALAQLPDGGKLVGHVGSDEILLVRRGKEIFAVAAHCTHYHGPLADGLVEDRMKYLDTMPHEMKASMAHDLEAGGRLEAPWLCGAVARMSAESGLEAPVNRAVYAALKPFIPGRSA